MKPSFLPTEEDIKAHDGMMECLTNLAAHLHLAQGWFDALFPFKQLVTAHDPTIMPKLVQAVGFSKLAVKAMSKKLLRDDDEAIDIMYEHIGKSISKMAKMNHEERKAYIDKLNNLE